MKLSTNNKKDFFESLNWRVFFMTFVATFIVVALQYLGVQAPKLFNPLSPAKAEVPAPETPTPKLKEKKNSFHLNQKNTSSYPVPSFANQVAGYIAVDYDTGDILVEKASDQELPIASLTKIMTAVVALDLASPSEKFTVSEYAASIIPTKIGVIPGEKLTVEELLYAAMLTSANDAVEVLREGIDKKYGKGSFVKAMNEKAKILGLRDSSFTNPQGFDHRNHYSSAQDLAVLSHYALTHYPLLAEISRKDYQFLPANDDHKQYDLYNWNGLIGVYPNTTGIKIGNTENAGKTTAVVSERDGKKVIAIILGAPGIVERDLWASQLLDISFAKVKKLPAIAVTEDMLQAKYGTWEFWN